ncbi:uncharacterized protein FTOL_12991 [Fusarium torulosum]|uniref:Uncharacterized protein n=1 Tax=Fusarium torulosum TaxID=33205 RepID=A0AAE8SPE7_9HYPO|nr:uncharacterized protein FTOL_12991 [Fusarium torulosum]
MAVMVGVANLDDGQIHGNNQREEPETREQAEGESMRLSLRARTQSQSNIGLRSVKSISKFAVVRLKNNSYA